MVGIRAGINPRNVRAGVQTRQNVQRHLDSWSILCEGFVVGDLESEASRARMETEQHGQRLSVQKRPFQQHLAAGKTISRNFRT